MWNLGPKLPHLGIFRQEFVKHYCHIWNKHSRVYQSEKYVKPKKTKFATKIPVIWVHLD